VAAIEQGFQKSEIERSAYAVAGQIDAGERVVVGVNRFALTDEEPFQALRGNQAVEAEQAARLAALRSRRDTAEVDQALERVRAAARGTDNVLPPLKRALAKYATVGEVSDALRDVWGRYQPSEHF
jgi:methylmalonyl-CoA mutase N-terminal domain/subunit